MTDPRALVSLGVIVLTVAAAIAVIGAIAHPAHPVIPSVRSVVSRPVVLRVPRVVALRVPRGGGASAAAGVFAIRRLAADVTPPIERSAKI